MTHDTHTETTGKTLIERLFAAGSHFGFTRSRRHPTALPFLFGSKRGVDIIDLEKTALALEKAKAKLRELGSMGKNIMFVGTKEEIASVVKAAAGKAGMPQVTNRWIGGTLTNFPEIKKRLARLAELTRQGETGELERKFTKKERVVIGRELDKLTFNFDGIKDIERIPDLLVIVDPRHDSIAADEAKSIRIPTIGITSSDCNLRNVTYPIVVNDALQASVALILEELTVAFLEGKANSVAAQPRPKIERTERTEHAPKA